MSAGDEPIAIGLDVGGTKVAGALVAPGGRVVDMVVEETQVGGRRDPGLLVTRRVAEELVRRALRSGLGLLGIGAGFPEYVTPEGELTSRLVLDWQAQPGLLLADLGPVTIESDVRCGGIAESLYGAGAGRASMLYLTVGTGISSAFLQHGVPLRGERGEAIALGELPVAREVDPDSEMTLEQFASGEGIRSRFAAFDGDSADDGARPCLKAANQGDPAAAGIVRSSAQALAAAAAWASGLLDPAVIVIGGGIGTSGGLWEKELRAEFGRRSGGRPRPPSLVIAALGARAGVVGAAEAHRQNVAGAHGDSGRTVAAWEGYR